jgi:uncharacterized protein
MIVDAWVNIFPKPFAAAWSAQRENTAVGELFGEDLGLGSSAAELLGAMDDAGVDAGILTAPLSAGKAEGIQAEELLALAAAHPARLHVSVAVDQPDRPTANVRRLRELAGSDHLVMVRVTPLTSQLPLNHRVFYPVYAACEEAQLPVSINVGVPGPRVRSDCQHPAHLEDVLIDFPDLTVIGAHMGHPYEALLIQYMMKWRTLHLMTSAYLTTYMDEALVRFMGSSRGRDRLMFASDHPVLPVDRALNAARKLPLSQEAMAAFLGGNAARVILGSTT